MQFDRICVIGPALVVRTEVSILSPYEINRVFSVNVRYLHDISIHYSRPQSLSAGPKPPFTFAKVSQPQRRLQDPFQVSLDAQSHGIGLEQVVRFMNPETMGRSRMIAACKISCLSEPKEVKNI